MNALNVLKLLSISAVVGATGFGGYLFLTKEEPPMTEAGVCPVTGARSHDAAPEIAGEPAGAGQPAQGGAEAQESAPVKEGL
ncbi:MAG: hypothetical protein EOP87_25510 [Verrucomicrobiaceae bacterium]|nr:MAG: hypothetical protein EOP87_25510 [Verrucomicrobiaceae bacterium]